MDRSPNNEKLKASLQGMRENAAIVEAASEGLVDAAGELCGTPCQEVVDVSGITACAVTWEVGCGDAEPPAGFTAASTVAELCSKACAFYSHQVRLGEEARAKAAEAQA